MQLLAVLISCSHLFQHFSAHLFGAELKCLPSERTQRNAHSKRKEQQDSALAVTIQWLLMIYFLLYYYYFIFYLLPSLLNWSYLVLTSQSVGYMACSVLLFICIGFFVIEGVVDVHSQMYFLHFRPLFSLHHLFLLPSTSFAMTFSSSLPIHQTTPSSLLKTQIFILSFHHLFPLSMLCPLCDRCEWNTITWKSYFNFLEDLSCCLHSSF